MVDNKTVTNTKTSFDADTNPDYTVATDEISSVEYQEVKIVDGTKGETTPVAVANGLAANAMRVTIASDSSSLTVDGVPELTVTNAIDSTAFDLQASAFSETSSITNDYILNSIKLNFSTTESKTITVTGPDGTKIYEDTNTNQSVSLGDINIAFNASENFTVDVTQFSSAGTMDCVAVITEGSASLGGDPSVTIASVNDTFVISEDTNFVTGDSPASFDVNTALGRNGTQFSVWNDGPGDFTVAVSNDGATFSGEHTMKQNEVFTINNIEVDTVRITWVANSAYRILAL